MIRITDLSKSFGTKNVLRNINVSFEAGKVYGIVGENGAGKTTLFRCLAGLEDYEGRIESDLTPLKNHLGLLPTEPWFFPKITGGEYLRLLCNARQVKLEDVESQNIFDLPLNQYASTYSTGMRKKLAFMAILLQGNHYFILDEPFNGVDIQSNIMITEIIHRLQSLNKTVLISSHIFSTLSDTCHEIHLLRNGEFIKSVQKEDFGNLEKEMKEITLMKKLDGFKIT